MGGGVNYREPGGKTARCWRCPFLYGGPPSFDNDVCMHPEWRGTIVVDDRPHDECLRVRERSVEAVCVATDAT